MNQEVHWDALLLQESTSDLEPETQKGCAQQNLKISP